MRNPKLSDLVMEIHDIARQVEKELGHGEISNKLRECADNLHIVDVNVSLSENKNKAEQ
jgi:hypothetical protein